MPQYGASRVPERAFMQLTLAAAISRLFSALPQRRGQAV